MRPDAPSAQASFVAGLGFMLVLVPCADPQRRVTAEAVGYLHWIANDWAASGQIPQATL